MAESFTDLPKHLQEAIGRLSLLEVEDVHALAECFSSLESVGRWGRTPAKYLEINYLLAPQVHDSRLRVGLVRAAELGARLHFGFDRWRELAIQTRLGFEHSPLESAHLIWCESLADLAEGFLPEAIEKANESLEVATEFEDLGLIGDSSFVLGSCLVENGKLDEARTQFETGVNAVAGVAELLDVHSALLQKVAMLDYVEGRENSNPQRRAREALDSARRAADRYQEARALSTEAAIAMGTGDFARAKRKFKAAEAIDIELDDWMCLSMGQLNLGNIALLLDEAEEALAAFERAEKNAQTTGNAMIQAMAMTGRAVISLMRGEPQVELLKHAIDLIEGIDVHIERLGALAELAVHQVWREEFAEAERTLSKAWRVALHVNESVWLATIARYRALVSSRLPSATESPEHWTNIALEYCSDETRRPSSWVPHDPTRIYIPNAANRPLLRLDAEARRVTLPDGTSLDFSRRGPLRLLLLALCHAKQRSENLGVSDLLEAAWPDEVITYDAARMRVYTSIKRLRRLGLEDWIETVDEGYRLRDELDVTFDLEQD